MTEVVEYYGMEKRGNMTERNYDNLLILILLVSTLPNRFLRKFVTVFKNTKTQSIITIERYVVGKK